MILWFVVSLWEDNVVIVIVFMEFLQMEGKKIGNYGNFILIIIPKYIIQNFQATPSCRRQNSFLKTIFYPSGRWLVERVDSNGAI
jgi:hypothetical protein